ncbi:hypothetical protein D3C80_967130 [compost metagenome]
MNLLHHPHEAEHRLALQAVHMLHDLRHPYAALHGVEQGEPAQHLHIRVLFGVAQRQPGHFVIG